MQLELKLWWKSLDFCFLTTSLSLASHVLEVSQSMWSSVIFLNSSHVHIWHEDEEGGGEVQIFDFSLNLIDPIFSVRVSHSSLLHSLTERCSSKHSLTYMNIILRTQVLTYTFELIHERSMLYIALVMMSLFLVGYIELDFCSFSRRKLQYFWNSLLRVTFWPHVAPPC